MLLAPILNNQPIQQTSTYCHLCSLLNNLPLYTLLKLHIINRLKLGGNFLFRFSQVLPKVDFYTSSYS